MYATEKLSVTASQIQIANDENRNKNACEYVLLISFEIRTSPDLTNEKHPTKKNNPVAKILKKCAISIIIFDV